MAIIDSAARSEGDNVSEIQSLASRVRDLTQSVDWWNTAMLWGLAFAAIAAIFVVVATLDLKTKDAQIELAKKGAAEAAATAKGFESKIADSDARVKSAEAQVASSMARSDEAVAQVKTADVRIAEAQRDAARANETAERERLARIQLEVRLADRTLTPEQQSRLVAALRPSAGTTMDVAIYGDTSEIASISQLIIQATQRAGWTVRAVTAMGGQAAVRGILIGTRAGADAATARASALVISSLLSVNISATPWAYEQMPWPGAFMGGANVTYDAPVRMFIGSKP